MTSKGETPASISPEMDAFGRHLASLVQETARLENARMISRIQEHFDQRLDAFENKIELRIDRLRCELRDEMAEVKGKQDAQGEILSEHSTALAQIEQRLEDGDKKFDKQNDAIAEISVRGQTNRANLAKLAGQLGRFSVGGAVGTGIGYAIFKMLQGHQGP